MADGQEPRQGQLLAGGLLRHFAWQVLGGWLRPTKVQYPHAGRCWRDTEHLVVVSTGALRCWGCLTKTHSC